MTELGVSLTVEVGTFPEQIETILDGLDVAQSTRNQYRREIRYFLSWLVGKPLYSNTLLDFKKFLKQNNSISTGTQAKYLAVARTFLRQLHRLGVIPTDITAGVKGIGVSRVHKKQAISEEDFEKAGKFLTDQSQSIRDRLVLGLLLCQGLRRIELTRLKVEDFNEESKRLAVLGKGMDDHIDVDLHPRVVELLIEYLTRFNLKSGPLFPGTKGKALCSHSIWRVALRVHKKLGIEGRNVHSWRKTFTTRLIQTGMNLLEVQGYTRHASIAMLQIYYQRLEKTKTLPTFYAAFPC